METGRFPVAMTTAKLLPTQQNTLVTTKMVYQQCLPAHTLTFGVLCVGLVVVCIVVTSKQDSCLSCCLVVLVVDY